MEPFINLSLTHAEYGRMIRLLGHHTSGMGLDRVFNQLVDARPSEGEAELCRGPLCGSTPVECHDIYGNRPVVRVDEVMP